MQRIARLVGAAYITSFAAALSLLLVLALVVSGLAAPARGRHLATIEHPVRELKDGRQIPGPALQQAIARSFPGFHQVVDCADGDFNGDGLEDAALYLSDRSRGVPFRRCSLLLVAFNQTPGGAFHPYLLDKRPDPSTVYDRKLHRRRRLEDYGFRAIGGGTFTIEDGRHRRRQVEFRPNDVIIEVEPYSRLWYFRGGRYHAVWDVGDDVSE